MTAKSTVIQSEVLTFWDLFHKGLFVVPWHQRSYDWKENNVQDLLHDIDEAVKEKRKCYFLGEIMLVLVNDDCWEINDGQQRMITVSLVCAALCRRFHQSTRGSQREGHALRMLFNLEQNITVTLDRTEQYQPRITPQREDETRYNQLIRGNAIGTNGKLISAWKKIDELLDSMNADALERYFDFLIERLEIACLCVPSQIDRNAVYETLNCRGKSLDDVDRIRNFIYAHFNLDSDSHRRKTVHENLERIRIMSRNPQKASGYMRCQLQCQFGFLRRDSFYRGIREKIQNGQHESNKPPADYIFELTQQLGLRESLSLYYHVIIPTDPNIDFVNTFKRASRTTNSPRNLEIFLRELRTYKVAQPLVFSLLSWYIRENTKARLVNKNLSRLATFVLRTAFVAPKFEPSRLEQDFSNFAHDIAVASRLPDTAFAEFLQKCDASGYSVLDDSKFQEDMMASRMSGTKKRMQFLIGINGSLQPDARLVKESNCTVEHILPESSVHWTGWTGFEDVDKNSWIQRLGNLTLLATSDNKGGSKFNSSFANKRRSFKDSSFAITRDLETRYADWNPRNIESRQREMAKRAVDVWKFH